MLSRVTGARPVPSIHGLSSWKKTCSAAAAPAWHAPPAQPSCTGCAGKTQSRGKSLRQGGPSQVENIEHRRSFRQISFLVLKKRIRKET